MLNVPVQAIPNQTFDTLLAGQACTIRLVQRRTGLFMDLTVNNAPEPMLAGIICRNNQRIVINAYFGFIGDFKVVDTEGNSDPTYDGLGTRFLLIYLEAADLA